MKWAIDVRGDISLLIALSFMQYCAHADTERNARVISHMTFGSHMK